MIPVIKDVCDAASLCLAIGAVTLTLPNVAALLSILWTLWRAGETLYKFARSRVDVAE